MPIIFIGRRGEVYSRRRSAFPAAQYCHVWRCGDPEHTHSPPQSFSQLCAQHIAKYVFRIPEMLVNLSLKCLPTALDSVGTSPGGQMPVRHVPVES